MSCGNKIVSNCFKLLTIKLLSSSTEVTMQYS